MWISSWDSDHDEFFSFECVKELDYGVVSLATFVSSHLAFHYNDGMGCV